MNKINKIIIREWSHTCGDRCCYNYGTDVIVNDKDLGTFNSVEQDVLEQVLSALGVEYEIENIDDHE